MCWGPTGVDRGVHGDRMVVTVVRGGRYHETLKEIHSDKLSSGLSREPTSPVTTVQEDSFQSGRPQRQGLVTTRAHCPLGLPCPEEHFAGGTLYLCTARRVAMSHRCLLATEIETLGIFYCSVVCTELIFNWFVIHSYADGPLWTNHGCPRRQNLSIPSPSSIFRVCPG